MSKEIILKKVFIDQFDALEKQLNGQSSKPIHSIRKEALADFSKLGIPTKKNEQYKYTSLNTLVSSEFGTPEKVEQKDIDHLKTELKIEEDVHKIILINGQFINELSHFGENLEVRSLAECITQEHPAVMQNLSAENPDKDAFRALNTAFIRDGVFIHIKKGQNITKPVLIKNIAFNQKRNTIINTRNLFLLEESSSVKIIQESGKKEANDYRVFLNTANDCIVGKNAFLHGYKVQDDLESTVKINSTWIRQARDSNYKQVTVTLNGGLVRNNVHVQLQGENAHTELNGVWVIDGIQHVDNHLVIDHQVPRCESNQLYKGIMDDKSSGVFSGRVIVRQDAQQTNAYQTNNNILLGDSATIDTMPQLEIFADDVKCSHGATTGQLDEEQLFYLRSRGLGLKDAKALLLNAFANEVVDKIEIDYIKNRLQKAIEGKLFKHL
ncbi:MAG: Fe-S cluster assembly protein SufD [Sphingobacteriales bacterium]|jgi:Fe-S cluster assembly protein SufD